MRPLVEELAHLVAERADDERLKWSDDGHALKVTIGKVIPADGFQQTIAGRRKRFRIAFDSRMTQMGWETTSAPYRYTLPGYQSDIPDGRLRAPFVRNGVQIRSDLRARYGAPA